MAVRDTLLPATALLVICLLATSGCRTNGNQELLERELRLLEDEVFHLEDHLEHYESMLASARRENAALRKQLAAHRGEQPGFDGGASPPSVNLGPPDEVTAPADGGALEEAPPFTPPAPGPTPQDRQQPGPGPEQPTPPGEQPLDEAPRFDPAAPGSAGTPTDDGPPLADDREAWQDDATADVSARADDPPPVPPSFSAASQRRERPVVDDPPALSTSTAGEPSADDSGQQAVEDYLVDRITLNRLLTGGVDLDDRPGDEGVMIVVEPRNAAGQIINVPGELAIVVVDPNVAEGDPRVARWDFTPDEAAARFRKSLLAEGIHIEMPWPADPPKSERLHVHVRFTTAEGAEFRADQPIHVEPAPPSGQWQQSSGAQDAAHDGAAIPESSAAERATVSPSYGEPAAANGQSLPQPAGPPVGSGAGPFSRQPSAVPLESQTPSRQSMHDTLPEPTSGPGATLPNGRVTPPSELPSSASPTPLDTSARRARRREDRPPRIAESAQPSGRGLANPGSPQQSVGEERAEDDTVPGEETPRRLRRPVWRPYR